MTREAAVLGIPTISIYQDELLEVDKYLIKKNRMAHEVNITMDFVRQYIASNERGEASVELLNRGKEAYNLITKELLS